MGRALCGGKRYRRILVVGLPASVQYGPVMYRFRDMITGRTTDGLTDVSKQRTSGWPAIAIAKIYTSPR